MKEADNNAVAYSDSGHMRMRRLYYRRGHHAEGSVYLLKIDADGASSGTISFPVQQVMGLPATSLQVTSDGGYIITGSVSTIDGTEVYLVKTDAAGEQWSWQRSFGGGDYDIGNVRAGVTDGGYIIAGTTSSHGSGSY
jgi:hypothetical protein